MISELIDSMVMPGIQGGPLMHIIAAKAVAFGEALKPEFSEYARQIVDNAKCMAEEFLSRGYHLVSGGTDTHLVLIDLTKKGITGKKAENALEKVGITVNKNMVPFDQKSPFVTSGIRIGTPAVTTRGMKEDEMKTIVALVDKVISFPDSEDLLSTVMSEVLDLCRDFPLYRDLVS
jgi:glycine hydroxymethyltransferase